MEVKDKILYHYHNKSIYDDIWQIGNELKIDNNFYSHFCKYMSKFSTAVDVTYKEKNYKESFDHVLEEYLREEKFRTIDSTLAKQFMNSAIRIIKNTNMLHREYMLEQYRCDNCPNLPSLYHSIWLTDYDNLNYWEEKLNKNNSLKLFKLKVTGNLFKSSDFFIPNDNLTLEEMYNQSYYYWYPDFSKEKALEESEYLFQGKVKII